MSIRGLMEHVGIDTAGKSVTVDGRVVDSWRRERVRRWFKAIRRFWA